MVSIGFFRSSLQFLFSFRCIYISRDYQIVPRLFQYSPLFLLSKWWNCTEPCSVARVESPRFAFSFCSKVRCLVFIYRVRTRMTCVTQLHKNVGVCLHGRFCVYLSCPKPNELTKPHSFCYYIFLSLSRQTWHWYASLSFFLWQVMLFILVWASQFM